jgi:hypothetical protein
MFQLILPTHSADLPQLYKGFTFQFAPYIQLNNIDVHDGIIRSRAIEDLQSTIQQKKDDK